jgi:hypothetical protein
LGGSYEAEYFGLRPDVLLVLFIPRDLRNRYQNSGPETSKAILESRDKPLTLELKPRASPAEVDPGQAR